MDFRHSLLSRARMTLRAFAQSAMHPRLDSAEGRPADRSGMPVEPGVFGSDLMVGRLVSIGPMVFVIKRCA